jgi:hypothetical protein
MRQHVFRQHARESASRDAAGEANWGPSDNSSASSHRRPDVLPSFRSWGPPERRSPPGDISENRRRTRPRHGSLRGTPPSARSTQFSTSVMSGLPSSQVRWLKNFPNLISLLTGTKQYHGGGSRFYPSSHGHRHSVGTVGSPMPPRLPDSPIGLEHNITPFLGHAPIIQPQEPRLPYMNHLGTSETDPRTGWPVMRPNFYPPVANTAGGSNIRMADAEATAPTSGGQTSSR